MLIVIEPRMVNMLWACAPIFCKHMTSFWCSFFDPHLSTHHLNIGVHILGVLDQRWSTLGITPWRLKVGVPMAMQCDLMVLSKLPESAVMQPDVNFTSGDSTRMHYIWPSPFFSQHGFAEESGSHHQSISWFKRSSQATPEWHPVTSLVAQTFLEGLNCLGIALA